MGSVTLKFWKKWVTLLLMPTNNGLLAATTRQFLIITKHTLHARNNEQMRSLIQQAVREAATICPAPASWHFDLESGVRVTCDVGYLCSNFSLPRPLCSRLMPDARGGEIIVNVFFSRKFSPFWSLDPIHLWTDHIKIWRAKVPFVLLNFVVIGRISRPYGIKKNIF